MVDCTSEKMRVIETATNLIKSDLSQSKDTSEEMSAEKAVAFVPKSLHSYTSADFISCTKVTSLGQAIIQVTQPRALLCPLQLGLGVQLHCHFLSRFVIDSLILMGFAVPIQKSDILMKCFSMSR